MKKFTLIILIVLTALGCKKSKENPKPVIAKTWIEGKWLRSAFNDTIFRANKPDSIYYFNVALGEQTLDFTTTASGGTRQNGSLDGFTYSLDSMSVTISGQATWRLTKISDTHIKLTSRTWVIGRGFDDEYIKE